MRLFATIHFVILVIFGTQPVSGQVLDVNVHRNVELEMAMVSTELLSSTPERITYRKLKPDEDSIARVGEVNGDNEIRSVFLGLAPNNNSHLRLNEKSVLSEGEGWKAGVARIDITPKEDMWMAGYGSRTSPSKGTLHPIWAKALALEDGGGKQSVLVTADLLGWPKVMSDNIRQQVQEQYGLSKAQIILNSSHTHTGPVLGDALFDIYPVGPADRKLIADYTAELTDRIVSLVGEALQDMEVVNLFSGNGVARFQVNRRNNVEATQQRITDLNGPNDYAVPVIKVEKSDGSLMAIVFGYACHPTVLSFNKWSGDYPGFAQIQLEKDHPGVQAMFFQGGGADQNPIPRRTVPLARQYGRTLAAAVDRVLEEDMNPLEPSMKVAYTEVALNLEMPPTIEELTHFCDAASGYQKRWGDRLLKEAKDGRSFMESYPFPLQIWNLGNQRIFVLGGELLIGYTIRLKEIFGYESFVMGYSNDVMSYIPTSRVLLEGGYEGATAQMVYGLPSKWSYDIETTIIQGMVELAATIDMHPVKNELISK